MSTGIASEPKPIVRCKFYFRSLKVTEQGDWSTNPPTKNKVYDLEFGAVTSGSEENKQFWHYTPSGTFNFTTINEAAAKQFEFGGEYYVDFTPAPKIHVPT